MGLHQHPRMRELQKRHSREAAALYDRFLRLHPELDGYIDDDGWTAEQNTEFRAFAAVQVDRHTAKQRELVTQLGGKLSPLSVRE